MDRYDFTRLDTASTCTFDHSVGDARFGACYLLVVLEERRQTLPPQRGHQPYFTLTVYTVHGAASPHSQWRNGSQSYLESIPGAPRLLTPPPNGLRGPGHQGLVG
jgi:hypothetical protein